MSRIKLQVSKSDLEELRQSGLTDRTISRNGLKTKNFALVYPYRDLDGETNGFELKKPHHPRTNNKGKVIKYEWPSGKPPRPYFPAGSVKKLLNSMDDIDITEGNKKALSQDQAGRTAIGLSGVYCWTSGGTGELIPELQEVPWSDRRVNLVFDYDEKEKTRRYVDTAERRFAEKLREAGAAEVYRVELPPGPDGQKQGVDDFIVAHGEQAYLDLIEAAEPVPEAEFGPSLISLTGQTDVANSQRLALEYGADFRRVGSWEKFIVWDGQHWQVDNSLMVQGFAKELVDGFWFKIGTLIQEKKILDEEQVKAAWRFAKSSNSARSIKSMVELVGSEPNIGVPVGDLDGDPWILNVENGTVNLKTGKLREYRRSDYCTKMSPVKFNPAAKTVEWERFLKVVFDVDDKLISFVQRLFGYALTGDVREQILPIFWGDGSNGKTTLLNAFMDVFGLDYCIKLGRDFLISKKQEGHSTEQMDLFGKRLGVCSESNDGRRLDEGFVKELCGGDVIRGRRMREDSWEYKPTHKVLLTTNHKPVIKGTDHAIWRRIVLVPFNVQFWNPAKSETGPDHLKQDKSLPEKLKAESEGILMWAIRGCLDWQRDGLGDLKTSQCGLCHTTGIRRHNLTYEKIVNSHHQRITERTHYENLTLVEIAFFTQ
jgi:P4 family phage/plasmid primase-like protien